MSQLASFTLLPVKAVRLLIPAAMVKKRLFRKPVSHFREYLDEHGKDLGVFEADGFYIVIVLLYLRKFCGINLLDANRGLALMAQSLTKHQDAFFTFFTEDDRVHQERIRTASLEMAMLKQLCEEEGIGFDLYNDVGTVRLALHKIADILSRLPDEHVVLVSVG